MFLRKLSGSKLNVFAPVNDLSSLSKSGSEDRSLVAGQKNDVAITGGQILGDEYSDHVVKVSLNDDIFCSKILILHNFRIEVASSSGRGMKAVYHRIYSGHLNILQYPSQVRSVAS
jgi:hypothetical protein